MLGFLFNSHKYRLLRELRSWRKNNKTIRETAWASHQKALIAAGNNPVRIPMDIFLSVILLCAIIWAYHAFSSIGQNGSLNKAIINTDFFFAIWAIQASVAALIYPIVIGFVSLLLQRRHSAKASLEIYLHDSAAILTGVSALFLVAAMGVQFFFISSAGEPVITYWLILDGIWFLLNIWGVIWFLVRTFDYLRPDSRAGIIRSYTINHILPIEIRRNLENHLFCGAVHYGWLPGPGYGDDDNDDDDSSTAILPSAFGRGMGDIAVTVNSKGNREITDVMFRPLSIAIRSWQKRVEKN